MYFIIPTMKEMCNEKQNWEMPRSVYFLPMHLLQFSSIIPINITDSFTVKIQILHLTTYLAIRISYFNPSLI